MCLKCQKFVISGQLRDFLLVPIHVTWFPVCADSLLRAIKMIIRILNENSNLHILPTRAGLLSLVQRWGSLHLNAYCFALRKKFQKQLWSNLLDTKRKNIFHKVELRISSLDGFLLHRGSFIFQSAIGNSSLFLWHTVHFPWLFLRYAYKSYANGCCFQQIWFIQTPDSNLKAFHFI